MILALLAAAAHAHPEWTGAYILEMSTVTRADVPVLGETVTTTAFGPGASLADVAASALSGHPRDRHAAP